jgi:hypothetical protein
MIYAVTGARHAQGIQIIGHAAAGLTLLRRHAEDATNHFGGRHIHARQGSLGEDQPGLPLAARLAITKGQPAAQPAAALGHALRAGQGALPDDFPFVGGKAGQQREHEAAAGGGGIEVLGEALDAHAMLFQFGDGLQGEARSAAEPIQAKDEELIEAVQAGVGEDAGAGGTGVKRQSAGDPIVGVDGADRKLVQGAVAFGKFALGGDGLTLALFFGGDAQIEGDGHAHPCVAR